MDQKIVHELITHPGITLPHLAFKNALLKPFREFRIFEHESPVLLVWYMLALLLSWSDSFETLWTIAHRLLCPWDFPGKDIGVSCHFLLPENLPNPGIEPTSVCCVSCIGWQFLYHWAPWEALSHPCMIWCLTINTGFPFITSRCQ